jgi:O-antigen/teichoic acid export membrane protein
VEVALRQGLQFAATIILARLLAPEDFGIFALLTFLTSFSIVFVQGGLTIALVQRQSTSHSEESAIFWWNLMASLITGAGFVAVAPAFAAFFGQPVLVPLVAVAAVHLILSAAGAVQTALLTRALRFDLLTGAGAASSLISGVVAIAAAFMGAGIWALALQFVSQALINTFALWLLLKWRPLMHFRFETIRRLFGFGFWVSIGNVMDVLYTNGISLLIGKLYGLRELGFYNRAAATQMMPSATLSAIIGKACVWRSGQPCSSTCQ